MSDDFKSILRFKTIVNLAPDIIYTLSEEGIVTSLNRSFERLTGWKAKDWIGKHFAPLIHPDDFQLAAWTVQETLKGKRLDSFELRIRTKNGNYLNMQFSSGPDIVGGKIIGKIGIARDITKQKRDQQFSDYLTKANKILFSSLNCNLTLQRLAKILVPEISDWCSIHIIEDNKLSRLIVAHEDPKKMQWAEKLQEEYGFADNEKNASYRVFQTGKSEMYPVISRDNINALPITTKQKSLIKKLNLTSVLIVPIKSHKKTLGVISLISSNDTKHYDHLDLKFAQKIGQLAGQAIENALLYIAAQDEIKKRKKVEHQLKRSRNELSAILENVADGITVFDKNAQVVYANPAIAKASGYSSANRMVARPLVWKEVYEVMDDRGKILETNELPGRVAALQGVENKKLLHTVNKMTGEERWAVVSARPILSNGIVEGSVSIAHDITERMELERRKDDFVSIASHELKTPITSIKGFVHLLKREHINYANTRSAHFIDRIDSQLNKLTELVEDLLSLSRLESGKLTYNKGEFELSALIEEVVGDLGAVSNSHKIIFKNGMKQNVTGDRDRIAQVLINLITNAIKYSPGKNRVTITMKKGGENVLVSVKDKGIGMDPSESENVFDRFYRVKDVNNKTFPGLGIGLYISKEIIERHQGKIWVKSKKDKGSTFHFSLPILTA